MRPIQVLEPKFFMFFRERFFAVAIAKITSERLFQYLLFSLQRHIAS